MLPETLGDYLRQKEEDDKRENYKLAEGQRMLQELNQNTTDIDLPLRIDQASEWTGIAGMANAFGKKFDFTSGELEDVPSLKQNVEEGNIFSSILQTLDLHPATKAVGTAAVAGKKLFDKLSTNEVASSVDDLIVQHNLYTDSLEELEAIGALPNPSMAITKADAPLQGFGEITLLGTPDMAKPSARNPVYRTDAYTRRRPNIELVDPVSGESVNPRFYNEAKHKYERATPENLSRYMRGGTGEENTLTGFTAGKARALSAKPFKTFKEVKDARSKIISGYDEVQVKSDFYDTFENLQDNVFNDMKNNVPAFKGKDTLNMQQIDSINYDLEDLVSGKFDPEVMELLSEKTKKSLLDFHETVQDLPASYFEVNPQRPVELREFANVLVPEGTSKQDILKLKKLGANKITTYKDGLDKVNKIKATKAALFAATPAFLGGYLANQTLSQAEEEEADLLNSSLNSRLGLESL